MKKVEEICKGDEVMETVEQKLKIYDQEFDNMLFYNPDELYKEAAYAKGKEDAQREIALKLLDQGLARKTIMDITGITYEKLIEFIQDAKME